MSQSTYQKNSKTSEDTSDSDVNHPASISDENDECSTQINITDPFSSTFESESFLKLAFGAFHEQFFHKLTSLTDFQKYDIKNIKSLPKTWLTEFP